MRRRSARDGAGTLVAAVAGMAVLVAMWLVVRHDPAPGIDRDAFSLLRVSRSSVLGAHAYDLATLVTILAVVFAVSALVLLARARRWPALAATAGGYPLALASGYVLKTVIARPRPAAPVLWAGGHSFPSTDAAVAVGVVVTAVVVAGSIEDRRWRVALVGAAAAAALGIDALLIALRVHYLTDVIAGSGLGVAAFAGAALACRQMVVYRSRTRLSRASRSSH